MTVGADWRLQRRLLPTASYQLPHETFRWFGILQPDPPSSVAKTIDVPLSLFSFLYW